MKDNSYETVNYVMNFGDCPECHENICEVLLHSRDGKVCTGVQWSCGSCGWQGGFTTPGE